MFDNDVQKRIFIMIWLNSSTRKLTLFIGLMFLVVRTVQAVSVIDISFLNQDPDFENSRALAYNARTDQFYLSRTALPPLVGGLIYTMGSNGNIVTQWDINNLVPNSNPSGHVSVGSITYDTSSNHLFISSVYELSNGANGESEGHLFETSIDGATLFNDITLLGGIPNPYNNDSILVGPDNEAILVGDGKIWGSIFGFNTLSQYTRTGQFVDSIDLSKLFPGFSGPGSLAASFNGGLFIDDPFREGVIEIDQNGKGLRYISTETLSGASGSIAIASDINSNRLFLLNDERLYTLTESDLTAMETPFPVVVPIPSAFLLFLSGVLGFTSIVGRKRMA
jgi:hypothetical protein